MHVKALMSFIKDNNMKKVLITLVVLYVLNLVVPTFVAGVIGLGFVYGVIKALSYMAENAPGGYEKEDTVTEVRIVK